MKPLSSVLIDVGDTLWPSNWAGKEAVELARRAALGTLPELAPPRNVELSLQLRSCVDDYRRMAEREASLSQDVNGIIRHAAERLGLLLDETLIDAIRQALCPPPQGHLELFPGATQLLSTIKQLGFGCVAVSNAGWRDAEAYRRDFEDMGISWYVDDIVSSVDVGFRKPHPAMFLRALEMSGCCAEQSVMIGNSERNDVRPALSLGMRAILVAIQKPKPVRSDAHAVVESLHDAAAILRTWAA